MFYHYCQPHVTIRQSFPAHMWWRTSCNYFGGFCSVYLSLIFQVQVQILTSRSCSYSLQFFCLWLSSFQRGSLSWVEIKPLSVGFFPSFKWRQQLLAQRERSHVCAIASPRQQPTLKALLLQCPHSECSTQLRTGHVDSSRAQATKLIPLLPEWIGRGWQDDQPMRPLPDATIRASWRWFASF